MMKNEIKQSTQDFNVENPSNTNGKNHGRQPAKLYYIGRDYKRRGFTTDQLIPCDGIQEVYITQES